MTLTRRWLVALLALVPVIAGSAWAVARPGGGASGQAAPGALSTAEVRRTTLVEQEEVDGELGYAGDVPVVNQRAGTITALAGEAQLVDRGQVLYEVDGRPVRLLFGGRPAWRAMAEGMTDGPDVRQLEENLVALGHGSRRELGVDDRFTAATTRAVKRWQKAVGAEETGRVELGDVVFLPGAVRVKDHSGAVGSPAQPGSQVLRVTSATRVVTVELEARRQELARVGERVEVQLPDGRTIGGKVAFVATAAESSSGDDDGAGGSGGGSAGGGSGDDSSEPKVEVTVSLDDPAAAGRLDQSPVKVRLSGRKADNVLAVPVNALLALAEGGYAVEVVEGGARRLVPVDTGLFSRGLVEVRGDGLGEGQRVVVPG